MESFFYFPVLHRESTFLFFLLFWKAKQIERIYSNIISLSNIIYFLNDSGWSKISTEDRVSLFRKGDDLSNFEISKGPDS